MNQHLPLGYDPKISLYKREQTKGRVMWYISYHLPGQIRMQRPVSPKQAEAKQTMRLKEIQLIQGIFDAKDQAKMDTQGGPRRSQRLEIAEALEIYFQVSDTRKSRKTRYNDRCAIRRAFGFLGQGKRYLDEIKPLDVSLLVRLLDQQDKAEATIKLQIALIKKVFNCLIEEAQVFTGENPVKKGLKLPKKGGVVRDRLITKEEIQKILAVDVATYQLGAAAAPIKEIFTFLLFTGARLSEALHVEWSDLDLEHRRWLIRSKPDCPTKEGLKWEPKWRKPRVVPLCPEVLALLKSLPRRKSIGLVPVRDEAGSIIGHREYPAEFVFTKEERRLVGNRHQRMFTRVDSIKRAWNSLKAQAGVNDLQLKDLRTHFNFMLRNHFHFTEKEAAAVLGHRPEVANLHYLPISEELFQAKLQGNSFAKLLGQNDCY